MQSDNRVNLAENIKKLGEIATNYKYDAPDDKLLEAFPNPFALDGHNPLGVKGTLNIVCPEFTSLCPKTGQPDFATIIIDYQPDLLCVESKSLKLYLGSFRNHGEFHESCICRIANDLVALLNPVWLKVKGEFTPRGGIPFWPTAEYTRPAETPELPARIDLYQLVADKYEITRTEAKRILLKQAFTGSRGTE